MKRIALLFFVISTAAFAECEKLEAADLQAKSRAELERRYCALMDSANVNQAAAGRQYAGGKADIGKRHADSATACTLEAARALDVLDKRFKARAPTCPTAEVR